MRILAAIEGHDALYVIVSGNLTVFCGSKPLMTNDARHVLGQSRQGIR